MYRTLGRRLLGAAAAATAAVAVSSPAYAAAPQIVVLLPEAPVAAGGSAVVAPVFYAERDVTLYNVKMTLQLGDGLAGVALTSKDPDCPLDIPTTVTCVEPPPYRGVLVGSF